MVPLDLVGDGLGWIKLFRKAMDSEVWANPNLWKTFCYCLLKAVHGKQYVNISTGRGQRQVVLTRGTFLFGRLSAAKRLGFTPSTTRNYMKKLEEMGLIDIFVGTHYSVITVLNYNRYQDEIPTGGQASDRQVTGKWQASDTYKNDKNDKNDKNKLYSKEFEEFWKIWREHCEYPNRSNKLNTAMGYRTITKTKNLVTHESILVELERFIRADLPGLQASAKKKGHHQNQFVKNAATWLTRFYEPIGDSSSGVAGNSGEISYKQRSLLIDLNNWMAMQQLERKMTKEQTKSINNWFCKYLPEREEVDRVVAGVKSGTLTITSEGDLNEA